MAVFASLFATMLVHEVKAVRKTRDDAVKVALDRVEQDARDFRLIGASIGAPGSKIRAPEDTARIRQVGSVRAIRESLLDVLEVAQLSVGADAAMLFVLNETGNKLKLKPSSRFSVYMRRWGARQAPLGGSRSSTPQQAT